MSRVLYVASMAKQATDTQDNRVRRHRRMAELTQAQLAEAAQVSRQTIVSIEAGDYSPSVYLALRIATTLTTTVEALFGPDDQPGDTQ